MCLYIFGHALALQLYLRVKLYLLNAWTYLLKLVTISHYQVRVTLSDIFKVIGSEVKVRQRWP